MIRQYGPQRHRLEQLGGELRPVGTIPVGTVFRRRSGFRSYSAWIIEAWLPGECCAARRDAHGRWTLPVRLARGGHLAQVRRLSDGHRTLLADHIIRSEMGDD